MLTLALTLTLSSLHLPPPSSLHLVEAQAEVLRTDRLLEIDSALAAVPNRWPIGSKVLMGVGFGASAALIALGYVAAFMVGGLLGNFVFIGFLAMSGLSLMLGFSGVIWGAVASGENHRRTEQLQAERSQLLTVTTF